jgi:hypothetical protein
MKKQINNSGVTVDFNLLFIQMFQISFRTSQIR